MRDSDWSRENLLRSDWLVPKGASITTYQGFQHTIGSYIKSPAGVTVADILNNTKSE